MLDEERADGTTLTVCGLITSVQRKITKRGDPGRWSPSRTSTARSTCCCSRAPTSSPRTLLAEDAIVTVKGRLSRSKDQPELHGQEVTVPDLTDGPAGPVVISLPSTRCTPPVVDQLKDVLGTHPGMTEVQLRLLTRELDQGDAPRRPAARHARARPCSPTSSSCSGPAA